MHLFPTFSYKEAKFGSFWKMDKNDWQQSRWKFSEEQPGTPFLTTKGMKKSGRFESRYSWRYNSDWLRRVTRMNRMPKVMLSYRPNWRRRIERPLNRLLDEAETYLSRPNSWRMTKMFLIFRFFKFSLRFL
jgi:hypothetical protein